MQSLREAGYPVADKLDRGREIVTKVFALTTAGREAILRALDDPPLGLAKLRGVLREHSGG